MKIDIWKTERDTLEEKLQDSILIDLSLVLFENKVD
jgi:hypothetical protein